MHNLYSEMQAVTSSIYTQYVLYAIQGTVSDDSDGLPLKNIGSVVKYSVDAFTWEKSFTRKWSETSKHTSVLVVKERIDHRDKDDEEALLG